MQTEKISLLKTYLSLYIDHFPRFKIEVQHLLY